MSFKEMQFKGNRVFVEVDESGAVLHDKGRARMKYRLEDDKVYSPSLANLSELCASAAVQAKPPDASSAIPSENTRRTKTAATKDIQNARFDKENIIAFTDGACSGNPGPAGLGYLICFPDGRRIERGEPLGNATNNIAELTAILRVLENLNDTDARIIIHTDSSYSIGVLTKGWKAKANQTLIATIKSALQRFKHARLLKVKGHAGIEENEIVDRLAREASETQQVI